MALTGVNARPPPCRALLSCPGFICSILLTPKGGSGQHDLVCAVAQSCLTLCHPMDCSPPDSLLMNLVVNILKQVAISTQGPS